MKTALALAAMTALLLPAALPAQNAAEPVFTPAAMRAHVEFLADDLLKGRDTGSEGHEIAARYVASQFDGLGLKPAGDNNANGVSWLQRITFQKTEFGKTPATLTVTSPAGAKSFTHAGDVILGINADQPHLDVTAPLVFVGYGLENARLGLNDYAGLDVKGKIVVTLRGYPKGLPSEEGAHLSATKGKIAESHGAIGMIALNTLQSAKARPWARMVQFADEPDFTWVSPDGVPFNAAPGLRASAMLNDPAAQAVFAGAPATIAAIRKTADKAGGKPKGFALKTSVTIKADTVSERVTSPNVVAILPGSDPKLKDEYVVLSAHLDHIGVSAAKPGDAADKDRINNGALDNGAGIATMLEVARAMAQAPDKPRRSIIFLASTAEEKGLLGADYYARHPSVPVKQIVGNVDLDMPLLLYPFTDLIAFGADHSTLGPIVAKAVAPMGVKLSPDPMPQETIFVRSDHYMFVKQGVPAVFLATGYANGGEKAWGDFLGGAYHHPGDDMRQKIDWTAGARFAEANYRITRAMADGDAPPRWFAKDFFGDLFAPQAEKAPH
ncbi:M20/M25/M40 family metallo-hydrolase [Sphingobium sp. AR-3-1]|uniref:M20/M25/M40 family metallo-hydrolase n=1 Tax=Sphingobium psychrophilum TaxID=2728834 RepID=A0A7X9WV58_9SPHN|nr:M28 family metallopeptidase [Sphingobium psychrophilum]NML10430.1 M20/M25/M40 family metallo-hydrolase [Sphingobium psychrophilum]